MQSTESVSKHAYGAGNSRLRLSPFSFFILRSRTMARKTGLLLGYQDWTSHEHQRMACEVISCAIRRIAWITVNCIYDHPIVRSPYVAASHEWAKERSPSRAIAAFQRYSSSHPVATAYLAGNLNQFVRVNIGNAHPS
jgi:hypothetical protein